eukprot:gene3137-1442_t
MAEYKQVKIGKLNLKGLSSSKKTKSKKRKHDRTEETIEEKDEDAINHGGWWAIKSYEQIRSCNVALQTFKGNYIIARDNGSLSVGEVHVDNTPQAEEIFTLVKLTETKVSFKSGYGLIVLMAFEQRAPRSNVIIPQFHYLESSSPSFMISRVLTNDYHWDESAFRTNRLSWFTSTGYKMAVIKHPKTRFYPTAQLGYIDVACALDEARQREVVRHNKNASRYA